MVVEVAATLLPPKKEMVPDLPFFHFLPFIHSFIFTMCFFLAGNQDVLQSEHAFAYWLATSTSLRANMRMLTGWQPARPLGRACVRLKCRAETKHLLSGAQKFKGRAQNLLRNFLNFCEIFRRAENSPGRARKI